MSENKSFSIEYNTRLQGFADDAVCYVASVDGKIRTVHVKCPQCRHSSHVNNGYHIVENSFIRALGLSIKIAQFTCKKCGCHWSTERGPIATLIQKEKEFVKSLLLGCARRGLSLASACALVKEKIGNTYTPQYLHELYADALDLVKQEKFSSASGVYYYDEQFLKENGKEICRLTVRDQVTGKIIIDKRSIDADEAAIKRALREALDGLPVDAFTVDMAVRYPGIVAELYPKAQIQWCIFHLYKLIWKELRDDFGKNISLQHLYNAYLLFNIFFNHEPELKKLEELLDKFSRWRFGNPKNDSEVENGLKKEFRSFVKALKKKRRREQKRIPRRTINQSSQLFATIKQQIGLFPKKLQKRIRLIDENWDRFTLFQRDSRVQPTNNGVEQYFGATLSKTEKKDFRSKAAVERELRACQAEWNGQVLFPTTNLLEILRLVGLLFRAFAPT
jgi:transposase-like protein